MDSISFVLRTLYALLYHQFAWSYDFVAALVSLGRWNAWVQTALPHLEGRVLELGFGPGHLQSRMFERGLQSFGVDESRQMTQQARRRLRKLGFSPNLTRGHAQYLSFPIASFNSVVATFPAEYIFEPQAINEIRRVLIPGGRLVVLPMAWIIGSKPLERLAAGLFRVTGEAVALERIIPAVEGRLAAGGFQVRHETVEFPGSKVLVVVAEKPYRHIHRNVKAG